MTAHPLASGPSHPLCLAALVVLVVNDHLLKAAWPGLVTGKLSDLAWLVVAPLVVAAVLARLGVADRPARALALGGTAAAFTLLQLWPPLGEAWVGWFGGRHVADAGDLFALPAILLAPRCWRPAPPRRWALPVAAVACLATSYAPCGPTRRPGPGEVGWDPHAPLQVTIGHGVARHDTVGVAEAISLRRADGTAEVEVALASVGNLIVVCPLGGLAPDTTYVWTVRELDARSYNHLPPLQPAVGTTRFTTASSSRERPIRSAAECQARADALRETYVCADSGVDTGAPATGDTGDTGPGDTADTGIAP